MPIFAPSCSGIGGDDERGVCRDLHEQVVDHAFVLIALITLSWSRLQSWTGHETGVTSPAARPFSSLGPLALAQLVERALDGCDQTCGHASVARRRFQLRMSEQRLDRSDVDTAIIEVGCKAMAQRVQVDRLPDPRGIGGLVEQPVELARRQRLARLAARKEQALLHGHAAVIEPGTHLPPLAQEGERLG